MFKASKEFHYCDCCKKKIKEDEIIFSKDDLDFCEKCFYRMLKIDNLIGNQNGTQTICEIRFITHRLCANEEIPY